MMNAANPFLLGNTLGATNPTARAISALEAALSEAQAEAQRIERALAELRGHTFQPYQNAQMVGGACTGEQTS